MAVRRISDLPNLDVCYPQSELSDCLLEVSYAKPDDVRRYQSFYENAQAMIDKVPYVSQTQLCSSLSVLSNYLPISCIVETSADMVSHVDDGHEPLDINGTWPNGRAIIDYIGAQGFLRAEDLGLDSIRDLLNKLDALLNRQSLFLFVAQCGVPYNNIMNGNSMRYDIVQMSSRYGTGKTIVWKKAPRDDFDSGFDAKYYTANADDIIFFKSIPDAVKLVQNFKFLEGAQIYIFVCTNLIEPLHVTYTEDGDKVHMTSVTMLNSTLMHSDMCALNIIGTKINGLQRRYTRNSSNDESYTVSIYANINNQHRIILRDIYSLYGARYGMYLGPQFFPTNISYLIFDACNQDEYMYDNITYSNYLIAHSAQLNTINLTNCAFMFYRYSLYGTNISITNCSFSNCERCLWIAGGNRVNVNKWFEALSCNQPLFSEEAGTILRAANTDGVAYIKSNSKDNTAFGLASNGSAGINASYDYMIEKDKWFLSAANRTENTYETSNWVSVDYDTVLSMCIDRNLSSNLSTIACNPKTNILIPFLSSSTSAGYEKVSPNIRNNNDALRLTSEDFITYMIKVTGNAGFSDEFITSDHTYSGYVKRGWVGFSLNLLRGFVAKHSNVYDNYETARFNKKSRFRSLVTKMGATDMTGIWDNDHYKGKYNIKHTGIEWNLSSDQFTISVYNQPGEPSQYNYNVFATSYVYKPGNVASSSSNDYGYSLQNWRTKATNSDKGYNEPNYSFKTIQLDNFNAWKAQAMIRYGYIFNGESA